MDDFDTRYVNVANGEVIWLSIDAINKAVVLEP